MPAALVTVGDGDERVADPVALLPGGTVVLETMIDEPTADTDVGLVRFPHALTRTTKLMAISTQPARRALIRSSPHPN